MKIKLEVVLRANDRILGTYQDELTPEKYVHEETLIIDWDITPIIQEMVN